MKTKNGRTVKAEMGSDNIYADLGLPYPEERLAKAANLIGITQPDVSNITRGRGRTYSLEMLMSVLNRLGIETSIVARGGTVNERIPVYARA